MTMTNYFDRTEFPFLNGETVTERIARICQEKGHATYSINGQVTGICPRCGENTLSPNTTIENDPNPPKIAPFFSDRVLEFADEVFQYVMNEFEGGDWREQFDAMTEPEKAAFFISLADGFSDETND